MPDNFADRLLAVSEQKNSALMVGIDPQYERIPAEIRTAATAQHGDGLEARAEAARQFGYAVIDIVADQVVGVKPQSAYFEAFGPAGVAAYADVLDYAHQAGLLVVADVKRGDIGSTDAAYAEAYLGDGPAGARPFAADALTVSPYLGRDAIEPFVTLARQTGRGLFVLVRTSNPSAGDVQDVGNDSPVYLRVAQMLHTMGQALLGKQGYTSLGAVVGATYPDDVARLRVVMPNALFLLPGFGAQGATAEMVAAAFDKDGRGGIVPASRSILYAGEGQTDWRGAISEATLTANEQINAVRLRR